MSEVAAVYEEEYVDFERASEVLADQLEQLGPYGKEDVDHLADAWEATHGRPLWRDPYESIEEFRARAAAFVPTVKPKDYFMDPVSGRAALTRLRAVHEPSDQQKREINALEELLDEPRTNFEKPRPAEADVAKKSRARYLRIQSEDKVDKGNGTRPRRSWQDRVRLASAESDVGCLQLLVTQDDNEQVREAATKRLAKIEATGR